MRRTCPLFAPFALATAAALAACSEPAPPPAPSAEATSTPQPEAAPTRPPFPNMATAKWGAAVMEERVKAADASGSLSQHLSSSLQALHSLDEGAAKALQRSATSLYATAEVEGDRSLGAALLAVGLVLDESSVGYRERLIDAHGLAMYAGTLEGGTAVAQAARAFVAISAGRVYEGEKLVDVMSTASRIDADTALLLALARFTLGQRNDELLAQAREALVGKPESARARGLLARSYLDFGLPDEALRVLDEAKVALGGEALDPALELLRLQALFLRGDGKASEGHLDEGLAAVSDVQRGEALYRLAVSAVAAGDLPQAEGLQQRLSSLSGFAAEAKLIGVRVSLARGAAAEAKAKALEVCNARGLAFQVAFDCQWAVTEACAAAGDEKCVDEWGKKAVGSDEDFARLALARAQLAGAKAGGLQLASAGQRTTPASLDEETRARLVEAHQFSPFDAALAKQLGLPLARGGSSVERVVKGARRALAFGARKAADEALAPLVKREPTCRVCRAVHAFASQDADEAAKRAAAAVRGSGPPLAERDLLAVIDTLGGSPIDEAKGALRTLERDPRPRVKEAVATAQSEQLNPDARAARKAKEAEAPPPTPGTVPVPGLPTHHDGHAHQD